MAVRYLLDIVEAALSVKSECKLSALRAVTESELHLVAVSPLHRALLDAGEVVVLFDDRIKKLLYLSLLERKLILVLKPLVRTASAPLKMRADGLPRLERRAFDHFVEPAAYVVRVLPAHREPYGLTLYCPLDLDLLAFTVEDSRTRELRCFDFSCIFVQERFFRFAR